MTALARRWWLAVPALLVAGCGGGGGGSGAPTGRSIVNRYVAVSASMRDSAVLLEDGSIYVWGSNEYCQAGPPECGQGGNTPVQSPRRLEGSRWTTVSLGYSHGLAIAQHDLDRTLWAWGNNGGRTGTGPASPPGNGTRWR